MISKLSPRSLISSGSASKVASSRSSSETVRPSCSLAKVTTPLRLNIRAVDPTSAIVPPLRVTATRTSEAQRFRLSVRHSISSAIPAGPYASYIKVS